ncbi:MAG: pyridoxamine 5'-phosphate oxidase [Vicinamibacterales bacterium]|nr:pyridoxamine 5'-phosphate oxidase [Vicinamibacterales bacterium]
MSISNQPSPFDAFDAVWRQVHATAPEGYDPSTIVLATADRAGRPSARMVLLRGFDPGGFLFYTNYGSRKAADLDANPLAALCGFWYWLKRQVRVEGHVVRATDAESDAYFASRPRGSQLGAWASRQSAPIVSRADLEGQLRQTITRFEGSDVPRPPFWGGYRLVPDRFEFWEEGESRLHDRIVFEQVSGAWTRRRLAP